MSKKKIFYRQCRLRRTQISGSQVIDIAWIPEQYAQIGKWLRIGKHYYHENFWQVETTSDTRKSEDQLLEGERDYMHQRGVSDV